MNQKKQAGNISMKILKITFVDELFSGNDLFLAFSGGIGGIGVRP